MKIDRSSVLSRPSHLVCAIAVAGSLLPMAISAQVRLLADPKELTYNRTGPHDISLDLHVQYGDFSTFNPATGNNEKVHLRTYNGQAIGPTIRMLPGDTMHVSLKNELPLDPLCAVGKDHNTPHCFNVTNLHTHGFHVSPKGISDNVLLSVDPQTTQPYEIALPADHPAGTFWYHSHHHGSTALQVSSGMEGALIVRGLRTFADKKKNGLADIDTVLKQSGGKKVTERIGFFQQVQYSCVARDGTLTWNCEDPTNKSNVGGIEQYTGGQFGPTSWDTSGRYTTINGLVQPSIPVHAGQIYRWRLIHGGVRDTIGLRITRSRIAAASPKLMMLSAKGVAAKVEPTWTADNCLLDQSIPQFEFAVDGLTRREMVEKDVNVLQPGYRSDVLTVFPEQGTYCVVDDELGPTADVNEKSLMPADQESGATLHKDRRLLALIVVRGDAKLDVLDLKSYLGKELYQGNPELPARVRRDLRNLKIAEFSPHADLPPSPANGHQLASFHIQVPPPPPLLFQVNDEPYKAGRIDHLLTLGATDDWDLTSTFDNHPYHIHVNPFQIVAITRNVLDANGKPILDPAGKPLQMSIFDGFGHCTELDSATPDPEYCDQIGVFRDTIFVKQGYHITARTKYETFDGDFVLHCHILDHEDQGMMQNVRIQDPLHPNATPFDMEDGTHPHMHESQ